MSFWLNVTNQARDDITRNAGWWADNQSLDEALKWYDSVYDQLSRCRHPNAISNAAAAGESGGWAASFWLANLVHPRVELAGVIRRVD